MKPSEDTIFYLKPIYTTGGFCPVCGSLLLRDTGGGHCQNPICKWEEFPQQKTFIQDLNNSGSI
jgi:NADH pyrophosphatase NudC (nudix superfamily)